ncbi:SDR family NAD(P)-dependent oxidoreductase [Streptomyces polygonati]|uniref:SDR family NAD(P)-dependent oxidoreductase n=1 Tax=Streptomyces polygonati TaxID=1617087 RepID=A0ABV8HNX7_9ACTN
MIISSPYPDLTIPDLSLPDFVLERAEERGDAPAVIDGLTGRALSYRDLAAQVRQAAAALRARGVAGGDVLGLCSPNSPEFVVAYYAASLAGATVTTMNPIVTGHEMTTQLADSGARWLVTSPEVFQDKGRKAAADVGVQEAFVLGEADGATPFAALLDTSPPDSLPSGSLPAVSPDGLALLPYSSGTSGLPKGVMLTHHQLVASITHSHVPHAVRTDDVVAAVLPLSHIFGMQVTMNLTLRAGATLVTVPRFSLDVFLDVVQTYRVTRAELVPPIVLALAKRPEVDDYDLSSLRVITSGAAPLGPDLAEAAAKRLGCRVKQGYGMTELSGASHLAPDTGRNDHEYIAPGMPGVESRVVDTTTGEDVDPGLRGELLVRTSGGMLGYHNNPEATARTLDADGWVHTGDIAIADDQGWIRVVDRLKELIKYKGYQVAPAELEDILVTHPAVVDCAVVGSPDPEAGEVPKALVVLRPGHTTEGLLDWVAQRVAPYQRIRRLKVVDEIPKSASGKILRRVIQAAERAGAEPGAELGDAGTATLTTERPGFAADLPLAGQVALVTGASRGLGLLIARAFAAAGASVGLVARSAEPLEQTVAELAEEGASAVAVAADVTDAAAMAAAVERVSEQLGPIDVLVNNAGITGPIGALWEVDGDEWWQALEVNLRSVVTCTQLVLPSMIARGRGRIVNITTEAGVFRWPLVSSYAVAKSAQIKLTENLAVELRGTGVTAFSAHPGLLPLGLSEPALTTQPPEGSATARVFTWIREQLESGHGVEPELATRFLVRVAAGDADGLSGRHLSVHDDLDAMAGRVDEIRRHDLYMLRRRESPA